MGGGFLKTYMQEIQNIQHTISSKTTTMTTTTRTTRRLATCARNCPFIPTIRRWSYPCRFWDFISHITTCMCVVCGGRSWAERWEKWGENLTHEAHRTAPQSMGSVLERHVFWKRLKWSSKTVLPASSLSLSFPALFPYHHHSIDRVVLLLLLDCYSSS